MRVTITDDKFDWQGTFGSDGHLLSAIGAELCGMSRPTKTAARRVRPT
jgi:hypothetical protein